MKKFLIGYTGFVGSNLNMQSKFDGLYASHNIEQAYGTNPDLIVYSAVPAQKFLANKEPNKDYQTIENAIYNIKQINPKKIVLISTIDVYNSPINVDEDTKMTPCVEAYGRNRLILEEWVKNNFTDYLIVRLPALYGENIKKNFIYDLINIIPSMLKTEKFNELVKINPILEQYYNKQENDFYKCIDLSPEEKIKLKNIFNEIGFSALNFTDSRAKFQFYNLANLWHDINIALNNNLKIINLATEPTMASEIYNYIYNKDFINEIASKVPSYDFKTKHYKLYNGENGYILKKEEILEDIKKYVNKKI